MRNIKCESKDKAIRKERKPLPALLQVSACEGKDGNGERAGNTTVLSPPRGSQIADIMLGEISQTQKEKNFMISLTYAV